MPVSQLSFTYTYTDSTSTNYLSTYFSIMEKIHHYLNCLDQPKIRKPYLPSQITTYESNYKNPILFRPFLGNKFKVGSSMN